MELVRDTTSRTDSSGMHHIYRGSGFEVEINTAELRRLGDELWQHKGDLILRKDQQQRTYKIIGAVGC